MNRMTGLILMITGGLVFISGLLIQISSKKGELHAQNTITLEEPVEVVATEHELPESDNELENAIQMAIADGALSNNERQILKQVSEKKGLDYKKVIKDVEQLLAESDIESETELIDFNKKQGDDFEKFIAQKFDQKYCRIKEWAGDKHINGVYAKTTTQPDILVELNLKSGSAQIWVECKWGKDLYNGGIQFASKEQFERYKKYQKERNIPVFVAIGLGGNGASPEQLFIVPLDKFRSNYIHFNYLEYFEKKLDSEFFFNIKTGVLK